jgi:hypothetical protein
VSLLSIVFHSNVIPLRCTCFPKDTPPGSVRESGVAELGHDKKGQWIRFRFPLGSWNIYLFHRADQSGSTCIMNRRISLRGQSAHSVKPSNSSPSNAGVKNMWIHDTSGRSRVRDTMRWMTFFNFLPVALGPRDYSASNRNEYQKEKNNVSGE